MTKVLKVGEIVSEDELVTPTEDELNASLISSLVNGDKKSFSEQILGLSLEGLEKILSDVNADEKEKSAICERYKLCVGKLGEFKKADQRRPFFSSSIDNDGDCMYVKIENVEYSPEYLINMSDEEYNRTIPNMDDNKFNEIVSHFFVNEKKAAKSKRIARMKKK